MSGVYMNSSAVGWNELFQTEAHFGKILNKQHPFNSKSLIWCYLCLVQAHGVLWKVKQESQCKYFNC